MKVLQKCYTKQKSLIVTNIIMYLVLGLVLAADIMTGWRNNKLSDIVAIIYPTIITVGGFLITLYFLFLEIYQNRYPLEIMQKRQFSKAKNCLIAIVYDMIVGLVALWSGGGYFSTMLFSISSIITIIVIIRIVMKSKESLMLTSHIKQFCEDINRDIEENKSVVSTKTIDNIKKILDECVIKEEYHAVEIIVEETGELFRSIIKNSIGIAMKNNNKNAAEESFGRIVELNMFEIKLCKSIKSSRLRKKIIAQQHINLRFCINNHLIELYQKYLNEYLNSFYKIQNDNDIEINTLIYRSFSSVIQCLYTNNKTEYAKDSIKRIHDINTSFVNLNHKENAKCFVSFLAGGVDYAIDNKNEDLIDYLIDILDEYLYTLVKHSDSFEEIVEYYKLIFHMLINYKYEKAIQYYEQCKHILLYNSMHASALLECNMFCLDLLMNNKELDEDKKEELINHYIDLIYQIGKAKEKYIGFIFFPDFEPMIKNNSGKPQEIKKITKYYRKLLNQCILSDNSSLFYEFISRLNTMVKNTKSNERVVQENLLSLYYWSISRTNQLANKQFLEISLFSLKNTIRSLDNNREISEQLGGDIIYNLQGLYRESINKNNDVCLEIIELLLSFIHGDDSCYFVISKYSIQSKIHKALFNIGTHSMENGFEDGVRGVSNALGWLIIHYLKNNDDNSVEYLMKRASELYNIGITMNISHKTRMFMLTLFPTVGAYCCRPGIKGKHLTRIINAIKNENIKYVETAVRLRTSENDMWNDLYEGKTDELTQRFMEKYKAQKGADQTLLQAKSIIDKT